MFDFKKEQKTLYPTKTDPSIVDVPTMTFIVVDGVGDPNDSKEYASAIELLYGLSYAIKMNNKDILQYVVPPLEGFWRTGLELGHSIAEALDKSTFEWTMVIKQPDFVTPEIFEDAQGRLSLKKPHLDIEKAQLETITEGLCVQALHIGSYDDEPRTIFAMEEFATESGYEINVTDKRRHHEIYIGDPRKVAPEKLKTIIRLPIE
jgi:hypothetical protein